MILNSKYDITLGYLNYDNPDNITQAFHEMSWVESKGIVDKKQNDDPDAYAKGLGLGKYQYEPESAKTALTRYKNWHEKNQPPNLDDMYAEAVRRIDAEDYDFSTLSEDHQDVYNLINYQQHPKTKMKDLSSGVISSKSFWAQYHATVGKFSKKERFKQWENQIEGLPELIPTKQSSGFSNAFVDLAPTVGDQEVGLSGVAGMNTPIGRFQANLQGDKSLVGDGFVAYKQDDTTGINVPIGSNTSFVAERRPAFDGGKENYVGVQYNKRFQEGGEIQDDVEINPPPPIVDTGPDVTSEVLPDTTLEIPEDTTPPPTYDKTEGFYSVNPAPDETADQFAQRTTEAQPAVTPQPVDEGSWAPPEGYVSPRITNSFESLFGASSWGDGSTTEGSGDSGRVTTDLPFPENNELSASQKSALALLGITEDVLAGEKFKIDLDYGPFNDEYLTDFLATTFNVGELDIDKAQKNIYGLDETFTNTVNTYLEAELEYAGADTLYELSLKDPDLATSIWNIAKTKAETELIVNSFTDTKLDTKFTMGTELNSKIAGATSVAELNQILLDAETSSLYPLTGTKYDLIDEGTDLETAKYLAQQSIGVIGGTEIDFLEGYTKGEDGKWSWTDPYKGIYDSDGNFIDPNIDISKYTEEFYNSLNVESQDAILGKQTPKEWFTSISNHTIGNMFGNELKVKNLYDEFASAAFVGIITDDWEKAGLAAATQFIKTDVVESYAYKVGQEAIAGFRTKISGATSVAEINQALRDGGADYDLIAEGTDLETAKYTAEQSVGGQAAAKFELYAGSAAAMIQAYAMGGDIEDAAWAGAEYALTVTGAPTVGSWLTPAGTDFNTMQGVGGAAISGLITLARTGDVGQAAVSAGTSYLFYLNPVLGTLAMALQLFVHPGDPKNYAAYTSLNLEDMSLQSFSQGDVDRSKASPENLEYTKQVMNNIMP